MNMEIMGRITRVETIAVGSAIREIKRLRRILWFRPLAQNEGIC